MSRRSRGNWTGTRSFGADGSGRPWPGRWGDAAADVALHQVLAELDAEDLWQVDPAVDAGDDVQVRVRDEWQPGHTLARAGIPGEGPLRSRSGAMFDIALPFVVEAA